MTSEQQAFLEQVRPFVPASEAAGVPGAVMAAQAVLESGWGRSGLAQVGNAWFGIKAYSSWPGRVYSGATREWVPSRGYVMIPGTGKVYSSYGAALVGGAAPGSLFRAYKSIAGNVGDYLQFFHRNPRYHDALRRYAVMREARRFAADIAAAGYATAPAYADRLLALVEQVLPGLPVAPVPVITVWVNGHPVPPEGVLVAGGRVYVHVRCLAPLLGLRVMFDPRRKIVRLRPQQEAIG